MAAPARIAIFPGSFDPPTNGHVDLIERAARVCDRLIVGLLRNPGKQPFFSVDDRVAMLRELFVGRPSIEVAAFDGLLVDFARATGATVVVRGVRGASDFEYERQLALTNRHLNADVDTVLLLPSAEVGHITSTLVREIATLGGSVRGLVPPSIESWIVRRPRSGGVQKA